jgi:hypothetical protein
MHLGDLLRRWCQSLPFEACPVCGGSGRGHDLRTLARERFSADPSGIEGCLARREFARAAALDDSRVLGDQLVHEVVRCGGAVVLVTSEEPMDPGLTSRIRRVVTLEGADADAAWACAR